ncbi:hypothetical protein K7711_25405 [Nocardia sp. CA2R105]|uniref:hypothetical protein n=1 Tax=Nocardia coffeae TaxID=2873381 RepID=UPI001CA6ACD6|nr:hypothetical protein [Nocardia coffeae]MBY8859830.1 hypothetical protein [Nocardia coffeae]
MERPDPNSPLDYDEALRIARDWAQDPGTLIAHPHQGLENARYGRGFAFLETLRSGTNGYVLVSTTRTGGGVLSADRDIDAVIAEHLVDAEHTNRHIPDSELSAVHRVALDAYDAGLTRIDEIPARATLDAETADYAEFILLILRNNQGQGDSGRKILAHNDFLLESPTPGRRDTQPCPHCGRPAVYQARYPRAVCGHCFDRTTDRAGRRVTGFNIDMSGGMIAYYTDTVDQPDGSSSRSEECVEVSRTGVCFIGDHPAIMQEARFGGIVVQIAVGDL